MNLQAFRSHIKTVPHATLDAYHDELAAKLARSKVPERRMGYALALDELVIEVGMRRTADNLPMPSDDELLAALSA